MVPLLFAGPARRDDGRVAEPAAALRVAIVEDDSLFRDLLRLALAGNPRYQVVDAAGDAEAALARLPLLRPDVAVLDIDLGAGASGIQLGMLLREQLPGIGIVLLSNHSVPRFLATLPPESMAGWCYLLKKSVSDVATLTRSLEGAAAGLVVLDPHLVAGRRSDQGPLAGLTDREREILELIAQGYTNAAIAERLVLSERTVENRLNQLYHELGLASERREFNPRVRAALMYLAESRPAGDGRT